MEVNYKTATLATGTEPFALTIRRTGQPQLYFPSLKNQNPQSPLTVPKIADPAG